MEVEIKKLRCPICGQPIAMGDNICKYCKKPITISTFNDILDMNMPKLNQAIRGYGQLQQDAPEFPGVNRSIAFIYLKLKQYDKAKEYFEKAIADDFNEPENYFYAAVSALKGKKAFIASRNDIDQIETLLRDGAISIAPQGIYYFFWAYIRYDYHHRKCYRVTPDYSELLKQAHLLGTSEADIYQLFDILNVECPQALKSI